MAFLVVLQEDRKNVTPKYIHELPDHRRKVTSAPESVLKDALAAAARDAKKKIVLAISLFFWAIKGHTSDVPDHARGCLARHIQGRLTRRVWGRRSKHLIWFGKSYLWQKK